MVFNPSLDTNFEIKEIISADDSSLRAIGELRVLAWATHIPEISAIKCWLDDFDWAARHWVVLDGSKIVASARMSIHSSIDEVPESEVYANVFPNSLAPPIASINRLVVHPDYRGLDLGKKLDLMRVNAAISSGCRCVIGETPSGEGRVKQLEGVGFIRLGAGAGPPPPLGPNQFHPPLSVVMFFDCLKL